MTGSARVTCCCTLLPLQVLAFANPYDCQWEGLYVSYQDAVRDIEAFCGVIQLFGSPAAEKIGDPLIGRLGDLWACSVAATVRDERRFGKCFRIVQGTKVNFEDPKQSKLLVWRAHCDGVDMELKEVSLDDLSVLSFRKVHNKEVRG